MGNKKVLDMMVKQFNMELSSGYAYLAMRGWCADQGMEGFARFMHEQAKEEYGHAERFFNFISEMGGKVEYHQVDAPKNDFDSFLDCFKAALDHEKKVTESIHRIYKTAQEEGDLATQEFLNWFVAEQREEEDTFNTIVERLERINEAWNGLYLYDRELGYRGK